MVGRPLSRGLIGSEVPQSTKVRQRGALNEEGSFCVFPGGHELFA
jgi:hypothetical protein